MLIKTLVVGMLETNCYVVSDETSMKCAIIDPGAESNTILDYIESFNLIPEAIILTHGHFDHHMALSIILESVNVPVYVNRNDVDRSGINIRYMVEFVKNMKFCKDGDIIEIGSLKISVIDTPGHSPGSITLMCENALFTGDTLFCGDCGRTDLDGGDRDVLLKSLRKLESLTGDFEVYPGHDETTTLDSERRMNLDMRIAMGEQI